MEIDKQFSSRLVSEEQQVDMRAVRSMGKEFATLIDNLQPDSREKSLAITRLEEAVFWSNAGIARNGIDS